MKRSRLLGLGAAAFLFASVAHAQGTVEGIVSQLVAQGYHSIQTGRTLLGRTRIVAEGEEFRREIIINARTGEILRDFWTVRKPGVAPPAILIDPSSGSGRSGGGDGAGNDDDDDDDDDAGDDDDGDDDSGDDNDDDDDDGGE